jgi:hypothetical protein
LKISPKIKVPEIVEILFSSRLKELKAQLILLQIWQQKCQVPERWLIKNSNI